MTRAFALLLPALLAGCGTEVTDLIPKLPCADSRVYPGGGLHAADVSNSAGMTLNGSAVAMAPVLRLSNASKNSVGSAYFTEPLSLDPSSNVSAYFSLRIGGGDMLDGADGLAFVLQSSPDGVHALGGSGGGLAYQNVRPSLAVEFDPYHDDPDPPGGHVAIMRDGDIDNGLVAFANPEFHLNDGVVRHVWIDYAAAVDQVQIYISDRAARPDAPLLTQGGLGLSASLGPAVFVGFSASTGERLNDHDLIGEAWAVASVLPACK